MATITRERLLELQELYEALKKRVLSIDEKYSLDYVEPKLDLPDSLNLQKLEYNPKSQEELTALAEQAVAAIIISKQANIEKAYSSKLNSVAIKISKNNDTANATLSGLAVQHDEKLEKIKRKAIEHGLVFSNVTSKYITLENRAYDLLVFNTSKEFHQKGELIKQEQEDAEKIYEQSTAALEEEKQARIAQAYQKLLDAEEASRISIEKYNNSLEEKEQKYQASRERTLENARRAAYSRALNNAKLYVELGESGYRQLIQREKYAVCQDAFFPLRRDEAQAILTFDSFLRTHLGTYYDSFVNWINTTLLP